MAGWENTSTNCTGILNRDDRLKVALTKEKAVLPSKREEDGAYDIYGVFDSTVVFHMPGETIMIPTGIRTAFSSKYVALLKERGSNGSKGIAQRAGVIDSGYRGEWFVPLTNTTNKLVAYTNGEEIANYPDAYDELSTIVYPMSKAICQMIMVEVPKIKVQQVSEEELDEIASERGDGALGSSGK